MLIAEDLLLLLTDDRTGKTSVAAQLAMSLERATDSPILLIDGDTRDPDLHTLFDRGYVTVAPEGTFLVSRRIREDFENGRDYYALDGRQIAAPLPSNAPPSPEYAHCPISRSSRRVR